MAGNRHQRDSLLGSAVRSERPIFGRTSAISGHLRHGRFRLGCINHFLDKLPRCKSPACRCAKAKVRGASPRGSTSFIPPWQSEQCTSFVKKTMPVRLRPEDPFYCHTQYPGDDVASSIQACEACRVGASPTHLTNFVPDGASEPLGLQNRCDGSVTRGHVQFHSIQAEIALRSVGNGQKVGASPTGGSALSQRRQVASHLAHNQKIAGSIPAAAIKHYFVTFCR